MSPKDLVLGGKNGLLGRALCEVLQSSGRTPLALGSADINLTAPDASKALAEIIDREQPSCIFNAVGYTDVERAEAEPEAARALNRNIPAMLGRLVKDRPCTLVHFSTDFVFDGRKKTPYLTDDPTNPLSVYGKTKREGEEALLALGLSRFLLLRTAWLFGPGKKNFIRSILNRCSEQKSLNVVHDQYGSPTYTLDLAQYTLKLVEAGASGIFHVVNSGTASWCELAAEAARLAQASCAVHPVPSESYPQKAVRPAFSVLDTEALTRVTGIAPRPWIQALQEYVFRDFPNDGGQGNQGL